VMGYSMTMHDGVRFTAWVEVADQTANLSWGDPGLAWRLRQESGAPAWELYDHRVDPGETRNLACSVCGWALPTGLPSPDELFETLKLAVLGGRPPDGWPYFVSAPPRMPPASPPPGAQTASSPLTPPPSSPLQSPSSPPESPSSPPHSQDDISGFAVIGAVLIGVPLLGIFLVPTCGHLRRWARRKRPRESIRV